MQNLLSVDVGKKLSGICLYLDGIIIPQKSIKTEDLEETILNYVKDYNIRKIIIGLPLDKDGNDNSMSLWIKGKIDSMKKLENVEKTFFNERLTTKESERFIREEGLKKKKKDIVDSISAMVILKEYMENEKF